MKLGIIREAKIPPDKRTPFTPAQVEEIKQRFPYINIVCETSSDRCYKDSEYRALNIDVVDDVSDCDILIGIKEVPVENLIENKTYLFFSHTMKKQPHNKKLLQAILKKNIKLIDYEVLRDRQGNRLVAFGRYAGIVGAYNALWAYGKRYNAFALRRAFECFDVNDLKRELRNVKLPPLKIILTGAGRVGKGAMETLDSAGIRKVNCTNFVAAQFDEPVYVQLGSADYHVRTAGGNFNREEFHEDPARYTSTFTKFIYSADMLLAGAFWNPAAPKLFNREDMLTEKFKVKIIADITCDVDGSIPSTKRPSTIVEPLYDYDPVTDATLPFFSGDNFVTTMAVDNLPCELPRSASNEFGRDLIDRILKPLLGEDAEQIIDRATIASNGSLTKEFTYLTSYIS